MPAGSVQITCAEEVVKLVPSQKSLHFSATVLPETTTDKSVLWSIANGNELATITQEGILTVKNINVDGTVKVRVTMKNDINIVDEIIVPVEGFIVKASSIAVSVQEAEAMITPSQTILHLQATVLPVNTTDRSVVWTLVSGEDLVNLSSEGVLSGNGSKKNGTVVVRATAKDGSEVYGELSVLVKDFVIPAGSVQIACTEEVAKLTPSQKNLHFSATVLPENTTEKSVLWSILDGEELATITQEGVLTVKDINVDGIVKVRVAMKNDINITDEIIVPVEGFIVRASSITVSVQEAEAMITPTQTSLHLQATVLPMNATDKSVVWNLISGEDLVTLSSEGLLSANDSKKNGTVVVRATAKDGSGTYGELSITVKGFMGVGISESASDGIDVYLSAQQGVLYIKGAPILAEKCVIEIYDLSGYLVGMQQDMKESVSINCVAYPKGIYVLRIRIGGTVILTQRIVI